MDIESKRRIFWVGSSLKDLCKMPQEVQDTFNFGLIQAARGSKHVDAKPLKGFGGNSVLEIVEDHRAGPTGLSTRLNLKKLSMCFTYFRRKVNEKLRPRMKIWI